MTVTSMPTGQLSLLLVGTDPEWIRAAKAAAVAHHALLDVQANVGDALAWMLRPERVHTHVLAIAPIAPFEADALAGMLDEVTLQPIRMLLLGSDLGHGNMVQPVLTPDLLDEALRRPLHINTASLPPLAPADLAHALHRGNLRMRFQPFVSSETLMPIGVEALARLHHPTRGILHPREFIPLAVESHQERVLTAIAVARTALELTRAPRVRASLIISVNVPIPTLLNPSSVTRATELCAIAGLAPDRIMVEVVETPEKPDLVAVGRALERWTNAGFRTAIDDAGPALPHWRDMLTLPFHTLKLDGSIADDIPLTTDIIHSAKRAGLFVIAEGIERESTAQRMRELGADALQGFLFSRPLPAIAVPLRMDRRPSFLLPSVRSEPMPLDRAAVS